MLLVLRVADWPICSQIVQLPVIGLNFIRLSFVIFFQLLSIIKPFDLSYLYKETKNSEAIFMVECVHNAGIFSIVAYKVQLPKRKTEQC